MKAALFVSLLLVLGTLEEADASLKALLKAQCPTGQDDLSYWLGNLEVLAGEASAVDVLDDETGLSVEEPGKCTTSYIRYSSIKEQLEAMVPELADGTAYRGNELGILRLNSVPFMCKESPWSENYCGIALGMPFEDHEIVRGFLDEVLGEGSVEGDISKTQGNQWNRVDLIQSATDFLSTKTSVDLASDTDFWVVKEVHKVALGLELTDEEIQELVELFADFLTRATLPGFLALFYPLGKSAAINNRRKYLEMYEAAIRDLIEGGEITSLVDEGDNVKKAAWTLFDAFCFAAVPSITGVIESSLGAYYAGGVDNSLDVTQSYDMSLVILEAIRIYPPVFGVPRINAETGSRHMPLVGLSGYDPGVFGEDAREYRVRFDFTGYQETLLNWADAALPNGLPLSTNHVCPAKSFSFNTILSFLLALDPTQWTRAQVDGFVLTKNN